MAIYRRKNNSDTWHWCNNCSIWPTSDYKEAKRKPTSGKFCNQCKAKEKKGKKPSDLTHKMVL
jgi:hypothetical protein